MFTCISGGQDLPWVCVRVPGCAGMAPQQGKSRGSALGSSAHRVPTAGAQLEDSPRCSWAGAELGASRGPPAPSSEAPAPRPARIPHPSAGRARRLLPAGDGEIPAQRSTERGMQHPAGRARRKAREEPLLLAHVKNTWAAAGRGVLLLGNRENRGIDTYRVLRKIAELFAVLDSRAINSTGSGAG